MISKLTASDVCHSRRPWSLSRYKKSCHVTGNNAEDGSTSRKQVSGIEIGPAMVTRKYRLTNENEPEIKIQEKLAPRKTKHCVCAQGVFARQPANRRTVEDCCFGVACVHSRLRTACTALFCEPVTACGVLSNGRSRCAEKRRETAVRRQRIKQESSIKKAKVIYGRAV